MEARGRSWEGRCPSVRVTNRWDHCQVWGGPRGRATVQCLSCTIDFASRQLRGWKPQLRALALGHKQVLLWIGLVSKGAQGVTTLWGFVVSPWSYQHPRWGHELLPEVGLGRQVPRGPSLQSLWEVQIHALLAPLQTFQTLWYFKTVRPIGFSVLHPALGLNFSTALIECLFCAKPCARLPVMKMNNSWSLLSRGFQSSEGNRNLQHSVRPLHHDPSVLGGHTWHGLVSLS